MTRVVGWFAASAVCALALAVQAQEPINHVSVPLGDPERPPTLRVQAVDGGMTVRGSNRRDVLVSARDRAPQRSQSGGTGLRRLAQPPVFTVEEMRNRITIQVNTTDRVVDLEIQVPRRADLKLLNPSKDEVVVEGVEGEIEINNPYGAITLNSIGGSVIASTVTARVRATITSLSMQPSALTSLDGDVDVTFPASMKANLKLRSDLGKVLTDFDLTPIQPPAGPLPARRADGQLRLEGGFIYGAVNGGGLEIELRTFNGNVYVRKGR